VYQMMLENEIVEGTVGPVSLQDNDTRALIDGVEKKISLLDRAFRDHDVFRQRQADRFVQSNALDLDGAVSQMYAVAVALEKSKTFEIFLEERGVDPHGNTKNPHMSLVRAFALPAHKSLRSVLNKRAAVIALARLHNIPVEAFDEWRKEWPIEKACKEYRRVTKLANEEFRAPDLPVLRAPVTRGLTGTKIALVRFDDSGSGKFTLIKILRDSSLADEADISVAPSSM
jgi:hypothetical protein